ncbi:PVC-type heme-binding CxxCH protein [Stieleria varia]|uniref:NPCBM/NEW2 domain protein n=1 Tax=Stieleria varia TaxID=2528005 RepID=A0A5C6B1U4_9BACT|nr:PVC-type heme-binding CxxCH protein [Stieleria varia]TWU06103.1 NPCBM/NEW2 domain protein [Stieleria varia]
MRSLRLFIFLPLLFLFAGNVGAAEDGFVSLFDGKTLENWDGNPKFWSVQDGTITGQTTADNPTKGNTFLIYRGGEFGNFELRFEYKIIGGNSGVQYRSFEPDAENQKWVVGGYQGDFEAGDTYSGILYGEKFRGILANRGQKTELVRNDGKFTVKVVGSVGESAEIQSKIKKEDWNEYSITADGFHFVHKINGVPTAECTDNDTEQRRDSGIIALQLHAGPPMKVQFRNIRLKKLDDAVSKASGEKKKVVFIAGRPSHGYGSHEHYAGSQLLASALAEAMPNFEVQVFRNGWPQEGAQALADADSVVVYCDGGGGHLLNPHLDEFDPIMKKGAGLVCIHYGVETVKGKPGDAFLDWMGGYFEPHWSVNPHWSADYTSFPDHPTTRGVKPFKINDEWYFHMRFRDGMKGVTPILSAHPPEETMRRGDGPHSGNPAVRKAVANGEIQHMAWAAERDGGGRGFGFTGGHFHWNWGDENFRKVMLNAIVWTAHGEVPANGVTTANPTQEDLEANQDEPKPGEQKKVGRKIKRSVINANAKSAGAKPIFASKTITKAANGVDINVELGDAKELYLVVTDGGNGYGCDWADWGEPRLTGPAGEMKLTDLKWKSATTDFGQVRVDKNAGGAKLQINGKPVAYGFGTHANSVIAFDLPTGYNRFQARAGLDNGGTDQGSCGDSSSVEFLVYTSKPPTPSGTGGGGSREASAALDGLEVGEGLAASLFAAEPQLLSPSNIDIDHRGRVWVCEIVNYRKHLGQRPEGDRILILEDTDSDGQADKETVYYQGTDIDSPHGVCVLGNKVIVSAGDKVQVFTDTDGDDKPDSKEVLFSGISGSQHDHGIHAFTFGPDGKLYFNFGNAGREIKDKDGNLLVDMAGNRVTVDRKPYQEGMVFRCNLDGSEFETLGWNFRNNWMVTVDSYGSLWQSDNDDDGNKGVRINYVMEFGNYGYKDEKTGAGWKTARTGMSNEVPLQHWHLNDPGVVPNLLQTGAGSPTGITVYEGDLLPMFRGQLLHCDAGPNVCRAYILSDDGAGYSAKIRDILTGTQDKWYRPSDVKIAPDGSLVVADWYDPGVGGHGMGDLDKGRLFRILPLDHSGKYNVPKFDFSTADGAIEALKNPNYATRYLAWQALHKMGRGAEAALQKMTASDNPIYRARALWLLGKIEGNGAKTVQQALADKDPNIRIVGIRLARQLEMSVDQYANAVVRDPSPQVRRELLVALRHSTAPQAAELWAQLAQQYDGKDRWYLEALGLASDPRADEFFATWLEQVGEDWNTPAGRDIVWRSRAGDAASYLVKILQDSSTPADQTDHYMRAFDFHDGAKKEAALKSLLGL